MHSPRIVKKIIRRGRDKPPRGPCFLPAGAARSAASAVFFSSYFLSSYNGVAPPAGCLPTGCRPARRFACRSRRKHPDKTSISLRLCAQSGLLPALSRRLPVWDAEAHFLPVAPADRVRPPVPAGPLPFIGVPLNQYSGTWYYTGGKRSETANLAGAGRHWLNMGPGYAGNNESAA